LSKKLAKKVPKYKNELGAKLIELGASRPDVPPEEEINRTTFTI
jgi:hypothetical protein